MLKIGARWRDCPSEYGPYTTIYNRFNRWSRQGVWLAMFKALTGRTGVSGTAAIDASHVKAHRSAAGGTLMQGTKQLTGRTTGSLAPLMISTGVWIVGSRSLKTGSCSGWRFEPRASGAVCRRRYKPRP